jgi:membrane-associated phospholipid phosphatase
MSRVRTGLRRLSLGTGLLAGSWFALRNEAVQRADVRVGDVLRDAGSPAADRVVAGTTDIGSMYGVVGTAAVLAAAGRREAAADVLGIGTTAWVLAQTNKRFVRRKRPYETHGVRRLIRPPTGSSFPSGHAAVGVAVMSTAADRARSPAGAAVLDAVGAYVAASRVYVGVHYPSDVIGGAGLGLVISALWRGPVAAVGRAGIVTAGQAAAFLLGVRLRGRATPPAPITGEEIVAA